MDEMTPEEREIMRLWRVIQRLTRWKGFKMNDKEEAVFGLVYQEFSKTRTPLAIRTEYLVTTPAVRQALKADLVTTAAKTLRALADLCEVQS